MEKKKETLILEWTVLAVIIISPFLIFRAIQNREVNFCRSVFTGLINGRPGIAKFIDWENFKAHDIDVGANYAQFKDRGDDLIFKRVFIESFPPAFKKLGGKFNTFRNWRVYAQDNDTIVVAADHIIYKRALLFTLSKHPRKLLQIKWR